MPGVANATTQQQQMQQASCPSHDYGNVPSSDAAATATGASASAAAALGMHLGGAGGRKLFLQPNSHFVSSSASMNDNSAANDKENNFIVDGGLVPQAVSSTAVDNIDNAAANAAAVLARQYQQQLQNQHQQQQQRQQIESSSVITRATSAAINNSNALLFAAALAASSNNNNNNESNSQTQQLLAINSALHAATITPAVSSGVVTSASLTLPLPTSFSTITANSSNDISRSHSLLLPGAGGVVNMVGGLGINPAAVGGSVPEFLYQLTKMLTDTSNREIIEWSTHNGNRGRIEVHNPQRLESQVLGRYFRHTRYSSFQRQLNYFGFRKIAGKGKMSPCSYLNDMATADICSLLLMRRKNNNSNGGGGGKQQPQQQQQQHFDGQQHPTSHGNPIIMSQQHPQQQQFVSTANAPTVSTMMIHNNDNKRRFSDFASSSSSSTSSSLDGCYTMVSADYSNTHEGGSSNSCSSSNASKNDAFNSMAANVAMNIANGGMNTNGRTTQGGSGDRGGGLSIMSASDAVGNASKRSKLPLNQQQQQLAPITSSSVPPSSNVSGRGYTVAIGKGVRHQLNGYLRQYGNNALINNYGGGVVSSSNNFSSVGVPVKLEQHQRQHQQLTETTCAASSTITQASSNSATTSTTSEAPPSSYLSYLAHPSAKLASSKPAPLQFLDPSELGMSIENSLNQLRDNFALAATSKPSSSTSSSLASPSLAVNSIGIVSGSAAVDSDTTLNDVNSSSSTHQALSQSSVLASTSTSSSTASSSPLSSSSTRQNKNGAGLLYHQDSQQHGEHNAPTLPPHRVSPTTNFMGRTSMLSRDDSLINLAMLPMLDTVDDVSGSEATGKNDAGGARADVLPTANESVSSTVITSSSMGNYDNNLVNNNNSIGESTNYVGGNDYISGMFSRDDSLINLLATVDAGSDSTVGAHSTSRQQPGEWGGDGCGGEMFGFIDFQG